MIGKGIRSHTILKYLLLAFSSRKRDVFIGKMKGPLNGKATDGFPQDSQPYTRPFALSLVQRLLCLTFGGIPLWQLEIAAHRQL